MLGRRITDPDGCEGPPAEMPGLGLLDIETVLGGDKRLAQVTGHEIPTGMPVWGYEMHLGITIGSGLERPMLDLHGHPDGAVSADGRVMGCYLLGLFGGDPFGCVFLAWLGAVGGRLADETVVDNDL